MKQSDSFLDYSWNLEKKLKAVECSKELKKEINTFIKNYHNFKNGKLSNIFYRLDLHYILESINKPTLIKELKKYNKELIKKMKGGEKKWKTLLIKKRSL